MEEIERWVTSSSSSLPSSSLWVMREGEPGPRLLLPLLYVLKRKQKPCHKN
jgi:hypothetical protein